MVMGIAEHPGIEDMGCILLQGEKGCSTQVKKVVGITQHSGKEDVSCIILQKKKKQGIVPKFKGKRSYAAPR